MQLTETRYGALAVVHQVASRDAINAQLKQLSPKLFAEQQLTYAGERVWCVVENVGLGHPPITVYEYRDEHGRPITDLSDGIVVEMQRRAQNRMTMLEAAQRAEEANAKLRALHRADFLYEAAQVAEEWSRMQRRHAPVHRSRKLAQVRAKKRAAGVPGWA